MKKTLLTVLFILSNTLFSQKSIKVENATVQFEASVPFFEPVAATNTAVHSTLNMRTGNISFEIHMKDFRFLKSLMQSHFNDNYLETDKHPKATFKGVIENFDLSRLTNLPKSFLLKGKLKIHGLTKVMNTKVQLQYNNKGLLLVSQFDLDTDDFNIKIPALVRDKIAKNVTVHLQSIFPVVLISLNGSSVNLTSKGVKK